MDSFMKTILRTENLLSSKEKRKQKVSWCYIHHIIYPGDFTHHLTALVDFSRKKAKGEYTLYIHKLRDR